MTATEVTAADDRPPLDLLHDAGEALFGPRWQRELARALGYSERAVRRWVAGDANPPADIGPKLRALIDARMAVLAEIRGRLR
jgi:hypothetical protein